MSKFNPLAFAMILTFSSVCAQAIEMSFPADWMGQFGTKGSMEVFCPSSQLSAGRRILVARVTHGSLSPVERRNVEAALTTLMRLDFLEFSLIERSTITFHAALDSRGLFEQQACVDSGMPAAQNPACQVENRIEVAAVVSEAELSDKRFRVVAEALNSVRAGRVAFVLAGCNDTVFTLAEKPYTLLKGDKGGAKDGGRGGNRFERE